MKNLSTIQAEVAAWGREQFGANESRDPTSPLRGAPLGSLCDLLGMVEELGELCHATLYRHQGRGFADGAAYRDAKKDALADVLIFMCNYAAREGIDLTAALNETWGRVRKRRRNRWLADKAAEKDGPLVQNGHGWAEPPYDHDQDTRPVD